ncbi:putative dnl zinc finger domain-containing protein [Rosellinia necatrix]|uniref:Putative dnl zinc finger domain-containing protein n=1 Tax=Rosellinia necatrix TaxID=77044 RepID=A0A1W2TTX2_ROSNE|nr:putative dnl zinc finger domain-containing protein [Rosellinia necatrix]
MASRTASKSLASILRTSHTVAPPLLRPYARLPRALQPIARRSAHTIPKPAIRPQDAAAPSPSPDDAPVPRKQLEPHYRLTFTCVPCGDRSSHTVSKQGYHRGSVLITCPSCRNRHVISDNLNIFGDRRVTVEELLREKGQLVKRGTLGEEGDIEFWEDAPAGEEEGEEERHEAGTLRDARDPSSRAADPTRPAVSGFPGSASARPSVQGTSHHGSTPSTRRQFGTSSPHHKPPASDSSGVVRNALNTHQSISQLRQSIQKADEDLSHTPIRELFKRGPKRSNRSAKDWRMGGEKRFVPPKEPARGETPVKEAEHKNAERESGLAAESTESKTAPGPDDVPNEAGRVRRLAVDFPPFQNARLVETQGNGPDMSVRLGPGVVLQRRPPGGILPTRPTRPSVPQRTLIPPPPPAGNRYIAQLPALGWPVPRRALPRPTKGPMGPPRDEMLTPKKTDRGKAFYLRNLI